MITVSVQLHTILQRDYDIGNINNIELHVQEGNTVVHLLEQLKISLTPEHLLLVVNGRLVESSYVLKNNDEVHLIPAISGGRL